MDFKKKNTESHSLTTTIIFKIQKKNKSIPIGFAASSACICFFFIRSLSEFEFELSAARIRKDPHSDATALSRMKNSPVIVHSGTPLCGQ